MQLDKINHFVGQIIPTSRQWRAVLIISMSTACLIALLLLFKPKPPSVVQPEKHWKVTTVILESTSAQPEIILHGKTESTSLTAIEAAITADVLATPVREGANASSGSLLLKLDDREVKLLLQQREAEVKTLEAEIASEKTAHASDKITIENLNKLIAIGERALERQSYLEEREIGTAVDVDAARAIIQQRMIDLNQRQLTINDHENRLAALEAQLSRAQALLAKVQLDLSRTTLFAPFDTRVARLHVAPGNRAQPGEVLMEIYAQNDIEIRVPIPTRHLPVIKNALSNNIPIMGSSLLDGLALSVQLQRLAGAVAETRGSVDAIFSIENEPPYLALARPVTVRIQLPLETAVYTIPNTALYGSNRVYRVDENNRLQRTAVTFVGTLYTAEDDSMDIIRSDDLSDGMKIITNQLPQARDKLLIEIVDE